jgi:hypothetical protein
MTIEEQLDRALRDSEPPLSIRAQHREALRQELLASFEGRPKPRRPFRRSRTVYAVAVAVALLLIGVSCAPTQYPVTIGKRIVFVVQPGDSTALPGPRAMRAVVEGVVSTAPVRVSALVERRVSALLDREGTTTLYVDVFDNGIDGELLATRLAEQVPGLLRAQRNVTPLDGRARGRLFDRFGHELHIVPVKREEVQRAREDYLSLYDRTGRAP